MTEVFATITHDEIRLEATGHAGGDVCVAISILCYTLAAALEGDTSYQLKPGNTYLVCPDTAENRRAFEFVERGFRLLEEGYPDRIHVDISI